MSYLHRFPIDILEDHYRSFVSRLPHQRTDNGPELARAVITLGQTLGLDTVAEGIELEPQVAALLALGCVAGPSCALVAGTPLSRCLVVLEADAHVAAEQHGLRGHGHLQLAETEP